MDLFHIAIVSFWALSCVSLGKPLPSCVAIPLPVLLLAMKVAILKESGASAIELLLIRRLLAKSEMATVNMPGLAHQPSL